MATLEELGEREVIRRLALLLGNPPEGVLGIGDDTAVVRAGDGRDHLLTSDAVVEGTHFLPETDPVRIGHKAVGRVLSDLAAMGGMPAWGLMDLVAPANTAYNRIESLYLGARNVAARHGLHIVGGDTTTGPVLEIHVFGVGWAPSGTAILRSGARPGDRLFVTGSLGGSIEGKHLDFEPRVAEGRWLREVGGVTAMIDISDGLVTDLRHIAESSRVGVELRVETVPLSEAARAAAGRDTARSRALHDGEDFELLFCVKKDRAASLSAEWKKRFDLSCVEIGHITEHAGQIVLMPDDARRDSNSDGYEHFRRTGGRPPS